LMIYVLTSVTLRFPPQLHVSWAVMDT